MQVGLVGFLDLHDVTIAALIFHLLLSIRRGLRVPRLAESSAGGQGASVPEAPGRTIPPNIALKFLTQFFLSCCCMSRKVERS
jgi:hypothetical protein